MARLLGRVIQVAGPGGETMPLQRAIYDRAFAPFVNPQNASLAYAVAFVLLWYVILRLLERRGLVLKV